jgi:exosortase
VKSPPSRNQSRAKAKALSPRERFLPKSADRPEKTKRPVIEAGEWSPVRSAAIVAALSAAVLWAFWPVITDMVRKWAGDPQYSHSYLVPAFAAYLLWFRRSLIDIDVWGPSWWGLPALAAGVMMRLAGAYVYFDWLEAVSLLPILAGSVLLLAGPRALLWSWPAISFLGFMIPLPYRIETALSLPLQRIATVVSTYVLQTLGRPAFAEGNVIIVNDARIGVVEACNGLGMLILFFAMAAAVAILVRRHPLEKAAIVVTAAPVAVAANVVRITATSFAHEYLDSHWADLVFHDLAGWLMMPLALGLLGLELHVLSRIFVDREPLPRRTETPIPAVVVRKPVPAQASAP